MYNHQTTYRYSASGIVAVAAAHVAVLVLLASLSPMPLTAPLTTLMVHIIAPAPPEPVIAPPEPVIVPPRPVPVEPKPVEPKPVERKPVVRPRPKPVVQPPVLAAPAEAPGTADPAPAPVSEAPPQPPAPAPAPPPAVSVTQPRFDADYLLNPAPAYPALSRRLGEEGKVVLRVFVEPAGRPSQIEIRTSSGSSRLDQAARDAVWRWKFVAARRGEQAIGAWVLVPIVFNLRN